MLTINQPGLTPEQIDRIPEYRHKWQEVALNRNPIDPELATTAINNAYDFLELDRPNIIFVATPYDAIQDLDREVTNSWGKLNETYLGSPVAGELIYKLIGNIRNDLKGKILEELQGNLDEGSANKIAVEITERFEQYQLFSIVLANFRNMANASYDPKQIDSDKVDRNSLNFFNFFLDTGFFFNRYVTPPITELQKQITNLFPKDWQREINYNQGLGMLFSSANILNNSDKYQLPIIDISTRFMNVIVPSELTDYGYYVDYCHQVLECDRDSIKWNIFQDLITNCGWIFPYKKTVIICDRN